MDLMMLKFSKGERAYLVNAYLFLVRHTAHICFSSRIISTNIYLQSGMGIPLSKSIRVQWSHRSLHLVDAKHPKRLACLRPSGAGENAIARYGGAVWPAMATKGSQVII